MSSHSTTDARPAGADAIATDPDATTFGPAGAVAGLLFLVCVAALTIGVWSIGRSDGDEASAGGAAGAPATANVALKDFSIDPGSLSVATGGTLKVANAGAVTHNLAVEGTDVITSDLDGGGHEDLSLAGLQPGSYTVYCEIAGHRAMGMEAQLTVADGGSGKGHEPTTDRDAPTAGHAMSAEEMDAVMAKTTHAFPAETEGEGALPLAPTVLPDGTKRFELTAERARWEVEPGKFVDAMTYNGVVPGPTLKVDPGDKVEIVLHNQLDQSTVVHFHGIKVPNAMDGVSDVTQPPIKPGETFTYSFTAQDTPAVGMYHSHHNAMEQVSDGMLGPFLIGELPLGAGTSAFPVPPGTKVSQEIPMVLNDSGTIGLTLNGKSFPATKPVEAAQGDWVLVHYMNEGAMPHPMHLHGPPQLVIAKDGFPLDHPYLADTVNIAPGERYSVLVHADQVGTWAFHCHILSHAEKSTGMFGMVTLMIIR